MISRLPVGTRPCSIALASGCVTINGAGIGIAIMRNLPGPLSIKTAVRAVYIDWEEFPDGIADPPSITTCGDGR